MVLVSLFLVNTRAAYYFVLALVSPRGVPLTPTAAVTEPGPARAAAPAVAPTGYTVRVGPLVATVEPGVAAAAPAPSVESSETIPARAPTVTSLTAAPQTPAVSEPSSVPSAEPPASPRSSVPTGAPARIGATIGALERLLIVAFVLVGAEAAVGFVIAAKTIARFKQLDDRGFAEYYLLGTLASVSVALASAIIAKAALGTLQ